MKLKFEMTDTFAGEANYSWVKRGEATVPDSATDLSIVHKAKKWAGLKGVRTVTEKYSDFMAIRCIGACLVVFINFDYENDWRE
jgi:hypothetical protein